MADYNEVFVGIDTSKLRNAVAIAEGGRNGEVRYLGEIENTAAAVSKLVKKLAAQHRRPDRVWAVPADQGSWPRLHGGGAVTDPEEAGRSGKDQPARRT
jgi:hypothetical protein